MKVFFSARVLYLLVSVLEEVLIPAKPTYRIKLREESRVLYEEGEKYERVYELPLVVCVKLVEVLSEIVDAAFYDV
jgi:hypothetical protein